MLSVVSCSGEDRDSVRKISDLGHFTEFLPEDRTLKLWELFHKFVGKDASVYVQISSSFKCTKSTIMIAV